jgi:diguanylate cyclase
MATDFAVRDPELYNEIMPTIVDEQTGLYAKEYFQRLLESQIERVAEKQGTLCYMLLDIDNFHDFNAEYNHETGDLVISLISDLLRENTRSDHNVRDDYVGMMGEYTKKKKELENRPQYDSGRVGGGEEFGVILPFTNVSGAKAVAERLRKGIEESKIDTENFGEVGVTVSIGIAEYKPGDKAQDLIRRTDYALMHGAKEQGKNQVVVYSSNIKQPNQR